MKELLVKLASVKKEIGTLSKNASNPFFKSKYLDLNEILTHLEPLLEKNGLILLQPVTGETVCTQIHDIVSGQSVTSCINIPSLNDPQKIGSAITYYRRYSLQSLLALQAEDDDGNKAVSKDDFTLTLMGCETAKDLNDFIVNNPIATMAKIRQAKLWEYAQTINCTYDKLTKSFK